MQDEIAALSTHPKDTCLIQQYADRLAEFKTERKGVYECFLSLDLEESDELFTTYSKIDKLIFSCCLKIKLLKCTDTVSPPSDFKGVKFPKLEVPSSVYLFTTTQLFQTLKSWYTSSNPSRLDLLAMPLMVCHALARTTRKLLTALGTLPDPQYPRTNDRGHTSS